MLIIPAILESYRSLKDRTLKVVFETNEPTPEQFMGIGQSIQQFGYLAFKSDPFKEAEKKAIEQLEVESDVNTKSPSKRQRAVLYRLWEADNQGFDTFNRFYDYRMEQIINSLKTELNLHD